jgi:type I restriction-modification system DNA methylase subunit
MPFFQNSVISKYLKTLDKHKVSVAYGKFKEHFHNPLLQENIRNSKEEQYQEGFITDLFAEVLGYTKNPFPDFNITTEYKNIKDGKKADGAIIINDKVKAVIELKGTDTTDLGKVEEQAFGYKNNQPECVYVIISNFEKLRFYIDNAIEHFEFNLFTLTEKEFELLYLCLAYENISRGIPKQIKDESLSTEDVITKKLYNDYSLFKRELHQNLVTLNPQFNALTLFKKSQKLLDRFLFLFFAEDRQLLPPNSVRLVLSDWQDLVDRDDYKPLYDRFKKYFEYLNKGFKGKRYDVFAYNGGLFAEDKILDAVKIDDQLLYKHTGKLADYDFDSEVDVNILGHIFENSLNELDEIKARIEGKEVDKSKTKRKKDGIFYTPKYITKYIVDNTVGKLCTEKKAGLQINEADYVSDKRIQKQTKQALADKLTQYRNWLLQIKICDPACGSGAFLNQALDFLIKEYRYIDELHAKLFGDALVLSDIENSILENNLFGVDLNEESVEIARLSLWLRTARQNRKLNDLSNNIKCGNSLIDDPAVAGEKAFNWFLEFPQVFPHYRKPKVEVSKEGPELDDKYNMYEIHDSSFSYKKDSKGFINHGFDVVIGNPPYGAKIEKTELDSIINRFKDFGISVSLSDSYFSFYALSLKSLLKEEGYLGFITPNTWRLIESAKHFRNVISNKPYFLFQIIQHLEKVFADATVDCDTVIVKKTNTISDVSISISNVHGFVKHHSVEQSTLSNQDFFNLFLNANDYKLKEKIDLGSSFIKGNFIIRNGVKPYEKGKGNPAQTELTMLDKPFTSEIQKDESFTPLIGGSSFHKYKLLWDNDYWIQYGEWLAAPRDEEIFKANEKLIFRQTSDTIIGSLIGSGFIIRNNTHILLNKDNPKFNLKYVLALLNSKLTDWYYWTINPEKGEAMAEVKAFHLEMLPFRVISDDSQLPFIQKADLMLTLNKQLQELSQKFQRNMQREFSLEDLPTKLQNWYLLAYTDLVKELDKKKIKLSLAQKAEWEEYFMSESKKAKDIKEQIDKTDKEIDHMVYKLYQLTAEEIEIVESKQTR